MTETLYKTKPPDACTQSEHSFELTLGEETVDGQMGYFVRETQCWWDAAGKRMVRVQYTLSPRGGFATHEEAHERYQQQRTIRARRGFIHSFAPRYEATKRFAYVRVEIAAQETSNDEQGGSE